MLLQTIAIPAVGNRAGQQAGVPIEEESTGQGEDRTSTGDCLQTRSETLVGGQCKALRAGSSRALCSPGPLFILLFSAPRELARGERSWVGSLCSALTLHPLLC